MIENLDIFYLNKLIICKEKKDDYKEKKKCCEVIYFIYFFYSVGMRLKVCDFFYLIKNKIFVIFCIDLYSVFFVLFFCF